MLLEDNSPIQAGCKRNIWGGTDKTLKGGADTRKAMTELGNTSRQSLRGSIQLAFLFSQVRVISSQVGAQVKELALYIRYSGS